MKRVSVLCSAFALVTVAAIAVGAFGCSKKLAVDPNYTMPEGVFSPLARLSMYREKPVEVVALHQIGRIYDYDSTFYVVNYPPGTVIGILMDATPAQGFELQSKQSGGGYSPAKDYALTPSTKWLDTHTEQYLFHDMPSGSYSPPTYVARGLIGGAATTTSVLSNEVVVSPDSAGDLIYTSPVQTPDSLFAITWIEVPGAVAYWVHVYLFRGDVRSNYEKLNYGVPAPMATGKIHTYVLANVPAPASGLLIAGPAPGFVHYEPMPRHVNYYIRVSAVDAQGVMIACTPGRPDTVLVGSENYVYKPAAEKICVGCFGSP
jgi:hypothetical protein